MVLVIIAVAVAMILSVAFLNTQSTSIAISKNIQAHPRARHAAESGLDLAIQYVRSETDWRNNRTEGTWVDEHPFAGGTFTITAEDGRDTNGDGTIDGTEGDGDLTDDPGDPVTLTATGRYEGASHTARAVLVRSGVSTGRAVFENTIHLQNSGVIDSFDSSRGPYDGTNAGDSAFVVTNASEDRAVRLENNSALKGDLRYGPEGSDSTVEADREGGVTGSIGSLDQPIDMPGPVDWPGDTDPNLGDVTFRSLRIIRDNKQYDSLTLQSRARISIQGDVTIRVNRDLSLRNRASLELLPGASLNLYVGGRIEIQNRARVNTNTTDPSRLTIYGLGSGFEHKIEGSSKVYAILDAPRSDLRLQNHGRFYGALLTESLFLQNNTGLHLDHNPALLETNPRLEPAGSGAPGDLSVTWIE